MRSGFGDAVPEVVRWGICGTGAIARRFVEELVRVPDAVATAVGSNHPGRAQDFADEYGIAQAFDSYEALAATDEVDVIYVASTQERHVDDVALFVGAGRHVLCEKPFALSLDDARAMCAAAVDADVFLMEAIWSRFLPSYEALGDMLASGAIGAPQLLEANFSFNVPQEQRADHRLFDPGRGGGALLDLGVYTVQLAHLIFGAPETVTATARLTDRGIDEQTALLLGWSGGAAAVMHASIGTSGTCTARLMGTEGVIELAAPMHCTTEIAVTSNGGREVSTYAPESLHYQVIEVHRCLRAGLRESPRLPHSETLSIMTTLDTALGQIGVRY